MQRITKLCYVMSKKSKSFDPLKENIGALEQALTSEFMHELSFLGSVLLDNDLQLQFAEMVKPEFFLNPATRLMADVIWEHLGENKAVTAPIVSSVIPVELGNLPFKAIDKADPRAFESYGSMIRDRFVSFEAMERVAEFRRIVYNNQDDIWAAISILQAGLEAIADGVAVEEGRSKKQDLKEMKAWIARAQQSDDGLTGVPTGYSDLNDDLGGWQPGDLIIKAARPGVGKTSDAIRSALAAACSGYPTAFVSLEMTNVQMCMKMTSLITGISYSDIRKGRISLEEEATIDSAIAVIEELPIYLIDKTVNFYSIRDRLRQLHRKSQIAMGVVDYMQLCEGGVSANNREQEVAFYSRSFKRLAKDILGIPIQVLSQLSRRVDQRANRVPNLSDLRESGAIEQDADLVAFLHRPGHYESALSKIMDGQGDVDETEAYFIIGKNRHGKIQTYRRRFEAVTGDFQEVDDSEGMDWGYSFREAYFPDPKKGGGRSWQLTMLPVAGSRVNATNSDEDVPF